MGKAWVSAAEWRRGGTHLLSLRLSPAGGARCLRLVPEPEPGGWAGGRCREWPVQVDLEDPVEEPRKVTMLAGTKPGTCQEGLISHGSQMALPSCIAQSFQKLQKPSGPFPLSEFSR